MSKGRDLFIYISGLACGCGRFLHNRVRVKKWPGFWPLGSLRTISRSVDPRKSPQFEAAQERARQALQDSFAAGEIEIEDFESRLQRVEEASRQGDLAYALEGVRMPLVHGEWVDADKSRVRAMRAADLVQSSDVRALRTYFSRTSLAGAYTLPGILRVFNLGGSVELDLREAHIPPLFKVEIRSFWGQTRILVPPSVRVTCQCHGRWARLPSLRAEMRDAAGPSVEIRGRAIGGEIEVIQPAQETWTKRAGQSLRRLWPFR